jgi:outer membrane immunogenic protein
LSQDYSSAEEGHKIGGGGSGACGLGAGDACNGRIYQIREIGGKLGWAMGRWMAYGTGGFADARINTWEILSGTHSNEGSNEHNGWFAGGGVDYALSKNAIVGIQYKHYDFGSESHIDVAGMDNRVVRAESDAIMSRMTLKFGLERGYEPLK